MIYAKHYASGEPLALQLKGGRIYHIQPLSPSHRQDQVDGGKLPYIGPGLIDLQINGYLGEDFNHLPISEASIVRFCEHMWSLGVTRCYPTLITNSYEAILEALTVIARVCDAHEDVDHCIAGIHLEGPFISPLDGARGAHSEQFVCPPNIDWLKDWQQASGHRIKIVTMSPEWDGSEAFIRECSDLGIVVSIGHTSATSEQIAGAVAAGARMITHFGNGVQLHLPRHPNFMWEQLAQDELHACVIADSYHLPVQLLKVVRKVKGEKTILVSDAVALAGSKPGRYTTFVGGEVVLTEAGKLHLAHNADLLAGSVIALKEGIAHMVQSGIAAFADAWDMASLHPAELMQLDNRFGLRAGAPADFVLFDKRDEDQIQVLQTYMNGKCMYQR